MLGSNENKYQTSYFSIFPGLPLFGVDLRWVISRDFDSSFVTWGYLIGWFWGSPNSLNLWGTETKHSHAYHLSPLQRMDRHLLNHSYCWHENSTKYLHFKRPSFRIFQGIKKETLAFLIPISFFLQETEPEFPYNTIFKKWLVNRKWYCFCLYINRIYINT